jgi:hypothetical protein
MPDKKKSLAPRATSVSNLHIEHNIFLQMYTQQAKQTMVEMTARRISLLPGVLGFLELRHNILVNNALQSCMHKRPEEKQSTTPVATVVH